MDNRTLEEIILKLAKFSFDSEKFSIDALASKAKKVMEKYPLDQTTIGMSNFLSKRANSDTVWITRAELHDVYNRLYTPNNKFAASFSTELGAKEEKPLHQMKRDPKEGVNLIPKGDALLTNALSNIFDPGNPELKLYSSEMGLSAEKICAHELNCLGLSPTKVDVVAGQSDLIICRAAYNTPKGEALILVPVELKQGKALAPTMFLSTVGFLDLEKDLIKEHLIATAGKSYQVDVQKVLQVISSVKNPLLPSKTSEVEQIVIKTAMKKGTPSSYFSQNIINQKLDPILSEVKTPEYPLPKEALSITEKLTSTAGAAEFILGKQAVDSGRNLVKSLLNNFGFKSAQVAVADNNKDTVFYAVALDHGIGFKVPVRVVKSKIEAPSIILSNGKVAEFSSAGIHQLLSENATDTRMALAASPMYELKPYELIQQIKTAALDKNFRKIEDALTLLQNSGDKKAYTVGYELYTKALKNEPGLTKEASVSTCSQTYKTASSKHLICAHTNLPIHKVYQDKNGDCHPLYRKEMDETSTTSAFFSTSRVLLG